MLKHVKLRKWCNNDRHLKINSGQYLSAILKETIDLLTLISDKMQGQTVIEK
jgi:hypothetical protein